jgi:hypothetical protein
LLHNQVELMLELVVFYPPLEIASLTENRALDVSTPGSLAMSSREVVPAGAA